MNQPILQTIDLSKRFPLRPLPFSPARGWIHAVQEVSLEIRRGESVGLVGESGCGKSTLSRLLCKLLEPSDGKILFRGEEISRLRSGSLKEFRRRVQLIFQDPMASLNPLMRIGQIIAEPMQIHRLIANREVRQRVHGLMEEVGLDPALENRFPHMLSGGQKQRVGIARALSLEPELLICDEPVSSLDLSVGAQILRLLSDLQRKKSVALFFISHNLATVSAVADRVLVMKEGRIIEEGANPDLFRQPAHPYTQLLVKLAFQTL
ncbi:MAG: ABC transporter ATP-binding protein [Candidatus Omnitrophica bacterium]|nr:ABC transporter ATP-binding protein [Candidatus Omnitrophota bacterium]